MNFQKPFLKKMPAITFGLFLFITFLAHAGSDYSEYLVLPHQTLTGILAEHRLHPIYGKRGAIQELLLENEKRGTKLTGGGHWIYPSQKIWLQSFSDSNPLSPVDASPNVNSLQPIPPVQKELTEEADQHTRHSHSVFSVFTDYSATQISATDPQGASAQLLSQSNFGAGLAYQYFWNESWATRFSFGSRWVQFDAGGPGKTLADRSQNLLQFGLEEEAQLADAFSLGAGLELKQEMFLSTSNATQVSLAARYVWAPRVFAQKIFFKTSPWHLGLRGEMALELPNRSTEFETKTNFGYGGQGWAARALSDQWELNLGLSARAQKENTSGVNQQQTDYAIFLKLNYAFGSKL